MSSLGQIAAEMDAERVDVPAARVVRIGVRLRRFIAFASIRAVLQRHAPPCSPECRAFGPCSECP